MCGVCFGNPDIVCVPETPLLNVPAAAAVADPLLARFEQANDYAEKHGLQPFTVVSPNFGLAEQVQDPWGGGCMSISGPENEADRRFYAQRHIPVFAYSSLGRGLFSGRVRSDDPEGAARFMDAPALKGYACPDNFERLRRCEIMAESKGVTVPQIAMAWLFNQRSLDVYALVSTSHRANMHANVEAAALELTDDECRWLNLESV